MRATRTTLLPIVNVRVHENRTCIIGLDKIEISNYPLEVFESNLTFFLHTSRREKFRIIKISSLTVLFHCLQLLSQDGMSIVIAESGVNVGNRIWQNSTGTICLTIENNLFFLIIFPGSSPCFQRDFFETQISVVRSRTRLTRNRVDIFKLFSLEDSPLK